MVPKKPSPRDYTREKFIASAHIPIKITVFSWLEHCPFYPFFYSFSKFYLASFSLLSFSDYYNIINCSKHSRRCYSNKLHHRAHRISCDKKSLIIFWNLMNKHSKIWLNTHEKKHSMDYGSWLNISFLLSESLTEFGNLCGKASSAIKHEIPPDPLSKHAYLPFQLWRTGWGTGWKKESIYPWCYCSP